VKDFLKELTDSPNFVPVPSLHLRESVSDDKSPIFVDQGDRLILNEIRFFLFAALGS